MFFGKESTQKELIQNLANEFKEIERERKIPLSDFPELTKMQELLKPMDFSNFPKYSERLMAQIEIVLQQELPAIMKLVTPPKTEVTNPFMEEKWVIDDSTYRDYQNIFESLGPLPENGCITGNVAYEFFSNRRLPIDVLRKIWDLVDFEKSGQLDCEEFALAMFLIERARGGDTIPDELPNVMIPPSKRKQFGKKSQ